MSVSLPPNQLINVTITAIITAGHVFVQIPENPTFVHLQRLEQCMLNVYERLQQRIPKVPKDFIQVGLVCVAKFEDKYHRLQVVSYNDVSNDCCEVKFLDYGGYDTVQVSELWQIRQDFMNLPFQVGKISVILFLYFLNLLFLVSSTISENPLLGTCC